MRGCGKTYLSREIQKLYPRVIIIDVTNEYSDGVECHTFEEFVAAIIESEKQEKFRIIYHSHMDAGAEEQIIIDHCIRLALLRSSSPDAVSNNILLVLEEIQHYSNAHQLPHYMRYNFHTGRHHGAATLVTSQMPAQVHKTVISLSHNKFFGQCDEPNAVKYLSGFLEPEFAEKLPNLPDRHFILRRSRHETIIVKNDFTK